MRFVRLAALSISVAPLGALPADAAPPAKTLVAFGDSIVAGNGSRDCSSYAAANIEAALTQSVDAGTTLLNVPDIGSATTFSSIRIGKDGASAEYGVIGGIYHDTITLVAPLVFHHDAGVMVIGATVPVAQGSCWVDKLATAWGLTPINKGIPGSFLETGTHADTEATAGFARYKADLIPNCTPTARVMILYGITDVLGLGLDSAFSPSHYFVQYGAIVASCIVAGTPPGRITLLGLPYIAPRPDMLPSNSEAFSAQVRLVAKKYGTHYVDLRDAMIAGGGTSLLYDGIHPNAAGAAVIFSAIANNDTPGD